VWLYFCFTVSFRDVEEMLAQRGIDVSYETVRCWTIKFGPQIARNLKRRRPSPSARWHLDEMVVSICGKRMDLWRAIDDEGARRIDWRPGPLALALQNDGSSKLLSVFNAQRRCPPDLGISLWTGEFYS
jgi:hypothetical protein